MAESVDLYNNAYGHYASAAEAAVRQETYGVDIGQSSWMTAGEWLHFADLLQAREGCEVLEVGSGSGGPAICLAEARRCRVTGVDINELGVANATRLAEARGIADQVRFQTVDANSALPFLPATFDAVVSNDAMCHIGNRLGALRDWYRVLRPGGRILFTDALVVTGLVSHDEVAARSAIGFYLFAPPGENERLLAQAGFTLLQVDDLTASAAVIAQRRHDARERYREQLVEQEGEVTFSGVQHFLRCVHLLANERRLSRYCYLAEKAADAG